MPKRQIIAMGGGGFSMEPDNLALDRYVIAQVDKARPRVCFIPTASGEAQEYILNFYKAFTALGCEPTSLSLFRLPTADLEGYLLEKDIIYVGGGNTRSMLALWREWEIDLILHKAYAAGVVLAGISAGANCWFQECSTDSVPGELRVLPCLGMAAGSFCPHYDGEAQRRPSLHKMVAEARIMAGYAADDGAAVHLVDDNLEAAVSSRPQANVYWVERQGAAVVETPLPTRYLLT